ncbi:folylpolyglutamate synthase/dihydrofolate synthase family protein [Breoghania sp. L-A4]|uniref:bifunctional folylpolyglutamate synthase/dihydrofolate synthase n=1 Tax=Breoghania sp. L-A4 TaxID=2304600 RepID=UPI000E3589D2|nr:folylpolyglutamate synthase/dihydrofolate synthase family protein [Breoghania sp. L-A4]AXS38906.1 bifunctional folylpolyglutamate synthase/dihydrofolate synthase [Breoghania sp. L-A4]
MDQSTAVLERLLGLHPKEIDLSLDRLQRLLDALGNPERSLPPTIHIAGTNGKGSTTAFMRAILEADGKSVHVYTSPHLVRFHERIRLGQPGGGRLVADDVLNAALLRCEYVNDGAQITFFEISTAVALCLFAEHPADVLLLEVGLGGRFDATNVIEKPIVSVITAISLDHERFLGSRLEGIALEKAGILKRGAPAVTSPQDDVVRAVIEAEAEALGAPLAIGGQDWSAFEEHGRLIYQDEGGLLDLPLPRLTGQHQVVNAGTAIAALRAAGVWPGMSATEQGLRTVSWPARLQRLTHGRLFKHAPEGADIWLDGGHNPAAGVAIASAMADLDDRLDRPLYLVCGMLNTKDPIGFFRPFEGLARHVMTIPLISSAAGISAEDLARNAAEAGLDCEPAPSIDAALKRVGQLCGDGPPRILICGSLYLAGDALALNGTPPE